MSGMKYISLSEAQKLLGIKRERLRYLITQATKFRNEIKKQGEGRGRIYISTNLLKEVQDMEEEESSVNRLTPEDEDKYKALYFKLLELFEDHMGDASREKNFFINMQVLDGTIVFFSLGEYAKMEFIERSKIKKHAKEKIRAIVYDHFFSRQKIYTVSCTKAVEKMLEDAKGGWFGWKKR